MVTVKLDPHTELKLQTAFIAFDDKNKATAAKSKRGYYNPYAFGIYMKGFAEVKAEVQSGEKTLAQALYDNFNDRLLSALERAVGLPVTYGGGGKDTGRPTY